MGHTTEISRTIIPVLEQEKTVLFCMLFGSASSGRMNAESDVDIAIAGIAPFEAGFLVELQLKLSKATGREVDIVDLNRAGGMIRYKIFESGKVLINRDRFFTERLIKKVISYSADMMPLVQMILERRAARFSRGL